mmetsp:Transcript_86069/g.248519  ORF Transcript_86069/g.248519 Transcript_86069/m.248519 type:complete len:253 (+) Transcript_86069:540-1298(+)
MHCRLFQHTVCSPCDRPPTRRLACRTAAAPTAAADSKELGMPLAVRRARAPCSLLLPIRSGRRGAKGKPDPMARKDARRSDRTRRLRGGSTEPALLATRLLCNVRAINRLDPVFGIALKAQLVQLMKQEPLLLGIASCLHCQLLRTTPQLRKIPLYLGSHLEEALQLHCVRLLRVMKPVLPRWHAAPHLTLNLDIRGVAFDRRDCCGSPGQATLDRRQGIFIVTYDASLGVPRIDHVVMAPLVSNGIRSNAV